MSASPRNATAHGSQVDSIKIVDPKEWDRFFPTSKLQRGTVWTWRAASDPSALPAQRTSRDTHPWAWTHSTPRNGISEWSCMVLQSEITHERIIVVLDTPNPLFFGPFWSVTICCSKPPFFAPNDTKGQNDPKRIFYAKGSPSQILGMMQRDHVRKTQ